MQRVVLPSTWQSRRSSSVRRNTDEPELYSPLFARERRAAKRYPITLDLQWSLLSRKGTVDIGVGHTIDLSSTGVRFEADRPLPVRKRVALSIKWPILVSGVATSHFRVVGNIVRTIGSETAIRMEGRKPRIEFEPEPDELIAENVESPTSQGAARA